MNSRERSHIPQPKEAQRQPELESTELHTQQTAEIKPIYDTRQQTAEDEERIQEIREEIQGSESLPPAKQAETYPASSRTEETIIDGITYTTEYVPRETIYPAFGYASGTDTRVRDDLPPRVKRFVKSHELYHCRDMASRGGWVGREIRANVVPGAKDPVGLLATIWETVSDAERLKFYLKRIREGF